MKHLVFLLLLLNSLYSFGDPVLKVGVISGAPPFSDRAHDGTGDYFFGFSIDIMNSICKRIQMQCIYQQVEFNAQLTALDNGKIDVLLLASPYEISSLSQYAISLPYATSQVQFIALKNSPIQNGSAIQKFKIGVYKTTFYDLLKKSPYGMDMGNEIIPFDSVTDLITGLTNHKVDLILLNNTIAFYYMNNNLYNIKAVSNPMQLGEGYGIVTLPANMPLIKNINKAILSMQMDGAYLAIFRKYYNQK